MKKLYVLICCQLIFVSLLFGQSTNVMQLEKFEPPNWWMGMRHKVVDILVYGKGFSQVTSVQSDRKGFVADWRSPRDEYLFITVNTHMLLEAGRPVIRIESDSLSLNFEFPVLQRELMRGAKGFDKTDIIYLITPDRFSNGDPENDRDPGMVEGFDSGSMLGRHGGDISGIINKLDYIRDLGVTAMWINPLLENNMPISYHGYAATDMYRIDPRFGTNRLYQRLVEKSHDRGLKVIMDHVCNHIGLNHPWAQNPPAADWLNGSAEQHSMAWHVKEILSDTHANAEEKSRIRDGWFVDEMPDLNQRNPQLARYLIQNTIWWIEYAQIDGIREDTYPYADPIFMSKWAAEIFKEYPDFNIVGEVWIHDPVHLAAYQSGSPVAFRTDTHLKSVTDYGLFEALNRVFSREQDIWELFKLLSHDRLYADPSQLMIFADNHDVTRLMDNVHNDTDAFKMTMAMLLTMRGIPQITYGTEIGLQGGGRDHGQIRADFPGGFANSTHNAFTEQGRSEREADIFNYVRKLIHLRRSYPALQNGRLIHFPPHDNVYVYLRENGEQKLLVVINNNQSDQTIDSSLGLSAANASLKVKNLMSGRTTEHSDNVKLEIPAKSVQIFELKPGN